MLDPESIPRLLTAGTIEVAPLAYMRGRTLNDAFIILDEAQNTSMEQMKMFLTRLGFGSKMVVTGDVTQVDLPGGTRAGCGSCRGSSTSVEDIAFCRLTSHDVVRHKLVGRIVAAYDQFEGTVPTAGMTVEINNESGVEVDVTGLIRLGRFALEQLRIHPQAELSILLVDEATMSATTRSTWASPVRPTCCRSRWTSCGRGRERRRAGDRSCRSVCSATSCSARPSPPRRAAKAGTATWAEVSC